MGAYMAYIWEQPYRESREEGNSRESLPFPSNPCPFPSAPFPAGREGSGGYSLPFPSLFRSVILIYKLSYLPSERFRDLLLLIYTTLKFIVIIYFYVIVDSVVINIIEYIKRGRTLNIIIIKLIEIDLVKEL